jgi:hypothetical protein
MSWIISQGVLGVRLSCSLLVWMTATETDPVGRGAGRSARVVQSEATPARVARADVGRRRTAPSTTAPAKAARRAESPYAPMTAPGAASAETWISGWERRYHG